MCGSETYHFHVVLLKLVSDLPKLTTNLHLHAHPCLLRRPLRQPAILLPSAPLLLRLLLPFLLLIDLSPVLHVLELSGKMRP